MVKPREMPRPLALTGITVHTKTLHEMTKQKEKCYGALEIYTSGHVDMLNKTLKLSYTLYKQSHLMWLRVGHRYNFLNPLQSNPIHIFSKILTQSNPIQSI